MKRNCKTMNPKIADGRFNEFIEKGTRKCSGSWNRIGQGI